jgi:hypothetical protein
MVKIDCFAPILRRIPSGMSWSSGDQDPVGKTSHMIHDSSPIQKFI